METQQEYSDRMARKRRDDEARRARQRSSDASSFATSNLALNTAIMAATTASIACF